MRVWAFPSIYPYDYPGRSFAGIFAHYQYKGLIEHGVELKVIQPVVWHPPFPFHHLHASWKEMHALSYPKTRVYDGITVYHPRIANMRPNRLVKKSYAERYVDAIVNFFVANKIALNPKEDIFYSQWLPDSIYVQQAAHKLGIKSAILAIGDDVVNWPGGSKDNFEHFKKLFLEADLRLANTGYLMKEANKLVNEDLPYGVVYFGVDYNLFKPTTPDNKLILRHKYGIPADKIAILIVGSALVRKGWLDLFDALVEVKKMHGNFVLVGVHGGLKDIDVTEEINKRNLSSNFINIGEVAPSNLHELYNTADIFCLPSHWEGLATVIIESMSSGLPVITTDMCGHPEAVTNGVTGVLIPPKDKAMLAKELIGLINDKDRRVFLGANARDFIVNKWGNFADNAAKLKNMLESTLGN